MRSIGRRTISRIVKVLCLAALGAAAAWLLNINLNPNAGLDVPDALPDFSAAEPSEQVVLPALEPGDLKPLSEAEALLENAQLPFASEALEAARPLILPAGENAALARTTAQNCLTAAVYYEAGFEPEMGKRGVAQVILNRVSHRAYPNSICNVVYQGSERRTGCQFSFTCDGSLARRPSPKAWAKAQLVAAQAIAGNVEPSVGMATHYHADYVVPYWASSLSKVAKLGRHYFYRWKGSPGRRAAFTQAATFAIPEDQIPLIGEAGVIAVEDLGLVPEYEGFEPGSNIYADQWSGTLDEQGSPVRAGAAVGAGSIGTGSVGSGLGSGASDSKTEEDAPPPRDPLLRADDGERGLVADERAGTLRRQE
jgi:hypothetical protein